ncbi:MAG: class I SAM-dependent DNA methyltransferase [Desulfobacterales bacterium]|nr:class I SAM-dependent DNA methyltransferase [Desulfobacterales bacterium]MDD4072792.1 class I SAM-dependent DNA methyltransferase [Desulfobacterales bacterium]MDD4392089.1 class I SAM-dependent DNA methyltransferase [Desulfobacterales bacterium]
MNLSSTIKSIQDIMRKDDGVDGDAQRIGQLTWMLFLKVFDQREEEWEDDAADRGETYRSPLHEDYRWRNWAKYITDENGKSKPRIQASELIDYVNNTVFPGLKELNIEGAENDPNIAKAKVVREVFEDTNNYMKSGPLMLGVIEKLDEAVDFHDFKTRQHLGDIYEQILNDLRSAGNAGEFYTPRAITHFMVQMVNPNLKKRETVLDPACGTGGFLKATIDHFRHQISEKSGAEDQKAIEACIHGIEKKQLPHLLCTTNLLLNGIDVPSQIEHRNTLAKPWNEWTQGEKVTCVITNPPFGGMEEDGVGGSFPADVRTRETADMFLTLISRKLLKEGGRAAVVLPDGALFGDGIKARIKEWLLDHCNLHTIVRLPKGVFNPYTSIKTNLLFFTKGKATETIWFYEHPYPDGYKSYSKTKPIRLEEFKAQKDWWGKEEIDFADRVESEFAWKIDFKTIKSKAKAKAQPHWSKAEELHNQASDIDHRIKELRNSIKRVKEPEVREPVEKEIIELRRESEALKQQAKDEQAAGDRIYWPIYNLDLKNPNAPEAQTYDPDELLAKYKKLLLDIEETQNQLKDELTAALAQHFDAGEND